VTPETAAVGDEESVAKLSPSQHVNQKVGR
jgi:hypothetical protein